VLGIVFTSGFRYGFRNPVNFILARVSGQFALATTWSPRSRQLLFVTLSEFRELATQPNQAASGVDNHAVHIAQKEPDVKKIIRILIASLLLAGSLSVYSLADGPSPTPCSPVTRVCG
jgi:hypothetical protein